MKRIFLDTNVVIDLLNKREPFYHDAVKLFTLAYHNKISLYISAITYATAAYLLRKHGKAGVRLLLKNLRQIAHVTTIGEKEVDEALASSFDDYEDALQYYSAINEDAHAIITRNKKDFAHAKIHVLSPTEFLQDLQRFLAKEGSGN